MQPRSGSNDPPSPHLLHQDRSLRKASNDFSVLPIGTAALPFPLAITQLLLCPCTLCFTPSGDLHLPPPLFPCCATHAGSRYPLFPGEPRSTLSIVPPVSLFNPIQLRMQARSKRFKHFHVHSCSNAIDSIPALQLMIKLPSADSIEFEFEPAAGAGRVFKFESKPDVSLERSRIELQNRKPNARERRGAHACAKRRARLRGRAGGREARAMVRHWKSKSSRSNSEKVRARRSAEEEHSGSLKSRRKEGGGE